MSYAGTYGDDETCRHGNYYRSCNVGCGRIGPNATPDQIRALHDKDRDEAEQGRIRERKACEMYADLDGAEKAVADDLWAHEAPGLVERQPVLDKAVRRDIYDGTWWSNEVRAQVPCPDSHGIGKARGCCRTARQVVGALRAAGYLS